MPSRGGIAGRRCAASATAHAVIRPAGAHALRRNREAQYTTVMPVNPETTIRKLVSQQLDGAADRGWARLAAPPTRHTPFDARWH
jgi:hypothetical protein